jgi:hypothetical protein
MSMSPAAASACADAFDAQIDAGAAAGTLSIYTGDMPADTTTAPTGTLLVTFTLPVPAVAAAVAGVAAWDTTGLTQNALADGIAGWYRLADSDGNVVRDGTVGLTSADIIFDSIAWVTGEPITLATGTTTQDVG